MSLLARSWDIRRDVPLKSDTARNINQGRPHAVPNGLAWTQTLHLPVGRPVSSQDPLSRTTLSMPGTRWQWDGFTKQWVSVLGCLS